MFQDKYDLIFIDPPYKEKNKSYFKKYFKE